MRAKIDDAAARLDCEPAALRAVISVESGGRIEFGDRLACRFEPHKLPDRIQRAIGFKGGYRASARLSEARRKALFEAAKKIDMEQAFMAASWGAFQLMGFNCLLAGYRTARAMVEDFRISPAAQIDAFVRFVKSIEAGSSLRALDWRRFAKLYNGPGNVDHYARLMAAAYRRENGTPAAEVLRIGSSGASVGELQAALNQLGYELTVDGKFGASTEAAVTAFQGGAGIKVDGVVGAKTWAALREADTAPEPQAQPENADKLLARVQAGAAATSGVAAAVGGLMDGLGETAQIILSVGVVAAVLIGVSALVWARMRRKV